TQGDRRDRHARQDTVRAGAAQDALRQDHAPHPAQDRRGRLRLAGRHLDARGPLRRRRPDRQPAEQEGVNATLERRQDGDGHQAAGRVLGLWRYPASALGGESMTELAVGTDGVEGDRLFGLVDVATGEIARPDAAPKWHGVPLIATRLAGDGRLEVRTPGSDWLTVPGEAADRAASAFLGFEASIRPFGSVEATGDGTPFSPRYKA